MIDFTGARHTYSVGRKPSNHRLIRRERTQNTANKYKMRQRP